MNGKCRLVQSASEVAAVVSPYGVIHDVFLHRVRKDDAVSWNWVGKVTKVSLFVKFIDIIYIYICKLTLHVHYKK